MPELPEVQTIVNDLRNKIVGKKIMTAKIITRSVWRDGRLPRVGLRSATISGIERKGKNILISLSGGRTLIIHLKMTGKLTLDRSDTKVAKHTHFIMELNDGEIRFNDIRRFGYLHLVKTSKLPDLDYLAKIGPDPYQLGVDDFLAAIKSKNRMIKALLLDQTVISGLGNIYTDEALFRAGISPKLNCRAISVARLGKLHSVIIEILDEAIQARGSSISDYVDADGVQGGYQNSHRVYGRESQPCVNCRRKIRREKIGGRSAHYCPRCQR